MAKLTQEQAATLAELERLRDAQDGDDVEVYVRDEKGRETRLTGAHAQRWLTNLFGEEGTPAPKKATKAAPKKATAPAAADEEEGEEEGEETEETDPPAARKHWLFGTPAATG
jgi:hypothetical protein